MGCRSHPSRHSSMMMMTFITGRGEGQGKTKERKATKSKGRGLEEGAAMSLAPLFVVQ